MSDLKVNKHLVALMALVILLVVNHGFYIATSYNARRGLANQSAIDVDDVLGRIITEVYGPALNPFLEYRLKFSGRSVTIPVSMVPQLVGLPVWSVSVGAYVVGEGWILLPSRMYLYRTGVGDITHYVSAWNVSKDMVLEFRLPPSETSVVDPIRSTPWFARGAKGYVVLNVKLRDRSMAHVYVFYGSHVANELSLSAAMEHRGVLGGYDVGIPCPPASFISSIPEHVLHKLGISNRLELIYDIIRRPIEDGELSIELESIGNGPLPDGGGGDYLEFNLVEYRIQPDATESFVDYAVITPQKNYVEYTVTGITSETVDKALFMRLGLRILADRVSDAYSEVSVKVYFDGSPRWTLYLFGDADFYVYYNVFDESPGKKSVTVRIEFQGLPSTDEWRIRVYPIVFLNLPRTHLETSKMLKPLLLAPVAGADHYGNMGVEYVTLAVGSSDEESDAIEWLMANPFMGIGWAVISMDNDATLRITGYGPQEAFPQKLTMTIGSFTRTVELEEPGYTVTLTLDDVWGALEMLIPYMYTGEPIPIALKAVSQNGDLDGRVYCTYKLEMSPIMLWYKPLLPIYDSNIEKLVYTGALPDMSELWDKTFYLGRGEVVESFIQGISGKRVAAGLLRLRISSLSEPNPPGVAVTNLKVEYSYYSPVEEYIGDGYYVDGGRVSSVNIMIHGIHSSETHVYEYPLGLGNILPDIDTEIEAVLSKVIPIVLVKLGIKGANWIPYLTDVYEIIKRALSTSIEVKNVPEGLKISWHKSLTGSGKNDFEIEVAINNVHIEGNVGDIYTIPYDVKIETDSYSFQSESHARLVIHW